MSAGTGERMDAGARYYGALTLPLYDAAVLNLAVPYAWGVPLSVGREMYRRLVGARHLDIGVATGYFLRKALAGRDTAQITLMDLNENATRYAARKLSRFDVTEAVGDALEPFPVTGPFDSIAMFHLLHCMPGTVAEKAVALDHAIAVLAPGGVCFGASVTPAGHSLNPFGRLVLNASNRTGALNNANDDHDALRAEIDSRFRDVKIELHGVMTLWEARGPR